MSKYEIYLSLHVLIQGGCKEGNLLTGGTTVFISNSINTY